MTTYKLTHDGFHGVRELTFRGEPRNGRVRVSERTARRLNEIVCGCEGCECAERVARMGKTAWYVELPTAGDTIRGHYPQSRDAK